ncbi:MAG: hypothetical protein OEY14_01510 [Myxococcales bacterium]|nr:hypothetical protein [Myxococcales bacterium]
MRIEHPHRLLPFLCLPALLLALASPAAAQSGSDRDFSDRTLTVGVGVGGYVPSLFTELRPHALVELDVGFMLPFMQRKLAVVAQLAYAPPGNDGTGSDARLGETGAYSFDITTHQLMVGLGPVFRLAPPGSSFVPYAGLLGRIYMLRTLSNGAADPGEPSQAPFGENTEESLEFGAALLLGGELRLGPGSLSLELSFGYSTLPHQITGDVSTSSIGGALGYRLFL